ncbi:hypothetical protein C8R43DRAFT_816478, partial [Mycena crocata]
YYDDHVASRVDARVRALVQRAQRTGEKLPERVTVQNEVTKEVMEEESAMFLEELTWERDKEYAAVVKAWEESLADSPVRTPEEFSASLKAAVHYLQPFVDAIGDRFGMAVSLLICGPVGNRGGCIEMRSVHSGKTTGL